MSNKAGIWSRVLAKRPRLALGWPARRELYPIDLPNSKVEAISPDSLCVKAAMLRGSGRFADADSILGRALKVFPENELILVHFALNAEHEGSFASALSRWADVRAAHPLNPHGYLHAANLLATHGRLEAVDPLLMEGLSLRPEDPEIMAAYARNGVAQGVSEGLRRWEAFKKAHPGNPLGYAAVANLLMQQGRLEEAEGVLSVALRSFPEDRDTLFTSGRLALQRNDGEAGVKRWSLIAERFEDSPDVRIGLASALRISGDATKAEACLSAGMELFPDDSHLASEFAGLAEYRRDFEAAADRWQLVRNKFGEDELRLARLIDALRLADRTGEAESVLADALDRYPNAPEIARAEALLAQSRHDWERCFAAWRRMGAEAPGRVEAIARLGGALRDSGRLEESAALLEKHFDEHPDEIEPSFQYATTLSSMRNWSRALPVWARLKERHGRSEVVQSGIVNALWQAKLDLGDQEAELVSLQPVIFELERMDGGGDKAAALELFSAFESLGDDCEFGMVQRRFGAEPLSLLRWTATPPEQLAEALRLEFQGVGDPDQSELRIVNGEYNIYTPKYSMNAHTFVFESAISGEKFFAQQCRRIAFLKRKLLEDLNLAEKIFVYKFTPGLSDDQIRNLDDAIRSYSSMVKLLCVKLADGEHKSGTVESVKPGLAVGYLKHFSTVDICISDWNKIAELAKAVLVGDRLATN